jgi:hypothetical protein
LGGDEKEDGSGSDWSTIASAVKADSFSVPAATSNQGKPGSSTFDSNFFPAPAVIPSCRKETSVCTLNHACGRCNKCAAYLSKGKKPKKNKKKPQRYYKRVHKATQSHSSHLCSRADLSHASRVPYTGIILSLTSSTATLGEMHALAYKKKIIKNHLSLTWCS